MASLGPKEVYLILYNAACCVGWSIVLAKAVLSLVEGIPEVGLVPAMCNVYAADGIADILAIVQSAALLEIVHSLVGLVRSPFLVTTMQVMSRIVALVAVYFAPSAQSEYRFCPIDGSIVVVSCLLLSSFVTTMMAVAVSGSGPCWMVMTAKQN